MQNNSQYKLLDYWDGRYKTEQHFDWFGDYTKFRSVIKQIIKEMDRILVLGLIRLVKSILFGDISLNRDQVFQL